MDHQPLGGLEHSLTVLSMAIAYIESCTIPKQHQYALWIQSLHICSMNPELASKKQQKTLHVQDLNSWDKIAVMLAQHFLHIGRFPQQPRKSRLNVAQHASLGAQRFVPQADNMMRPFLVAEEFYDRGPPIFSCGSSIKSSTPHPKVNLCKKQASPR